VRRLTISHPDDAETIPLDDPRPCVGWWELECESGRRTRWTNGNAGLLLARGGPAVLEVEFGTLEASGEEAAMPKPLPEAPRRAWHR
jgi:hypothetical protein